MTYPIDTCILEHMAASGPQEHNDLRRYCEQQAVPYSYLDFVEVVTDLCITGQIVADVNGEDTKPVLFYDFPESYYTGKPQLT